MTGENGLQKILRATALLGGSSVAGILLGLLSTKVWAGMVGPGGLGYQGLLQSILGITTMLAGLNLGTALVRRGALALAQEDEAEFAALKQGAWLLLWAVGASVALLMVLLQAPIARTTLGGDSRGIDVALVAAALLFTLATSVQNGILNARHQVRSLARISLLGGVLGAAVSVLLAVLFRERALAWVVLALPAIMWLVSFAHYRRAERGGQRVDGAHARAAAWDLARIGLPFCVSQFVGAGVQLVLPILILHLAGQESVGYYRAAIMISVNYLACLLSAMFQDYYPRVSAASDQPAVLNEMVNQQYRMILLLGAPMIFWLLALSPWIVPLVYSRSFLPTTTILNWQLVGDLFKLTSWTLGFVILARSPARTYLTTEIIAGGSLLAACWLGMKVWGLTGVGVAYLLSYALHLLVVWWVVRREIGFRFSAANKQAIGWIVGATLVTQAALTPALSAWHVPVGVTVAALLTVFCGVTLLRELRGEKAAPTPPGRDGLAPHPIA